MDIELTPELLIAIVSVIGAVTSLVAAAISFKRETIVSRLKTKEFEQQAIEKKKEFEKAVREDTVGLYRRLSSQYESMTQKDKQLLRTITFVIRHLIVLDRTLSDLIGEMETRWDVHKVEADTIKCPYYHDMTEYMWARVLGIEEIVSETMEEIDVFLLNGNGKEEKQE